MRENDKKDPNHPGSKYGDFYICGAKSASKRLFSCQNEQMILRQASKSEP